jgi:hypothetical protein
MIKERTEWVSTTSARKGWVRWAGKYKVCICFSKTDRNAMKIYHVEDFLRIYKKAL